MSKYANIIEQLQYGSLAEEIDQKLSELIKACESTQRQGEITVTFKLKPGKGNSGQMEITPAVKAKVPEVERGSAIMFITPAGDLTQQDPRQKELDLKKLAETAKTPMKIAGAK